MGAIGAALLVHEEMAAGGSSTQFTGFDRSNMKYRSSSFECKACPNHCEIAQLSLDGKALARWGGRCDMWERVPAGQ
jgi:hypothetical protein